MEQHRNSQTSLLSAIMGSPSPASVVAPQAGPPKLTPSVGPRKQRSGGQSRAIRRERKADRVNHTEKVQKQTAILKRKREQVLDTAAQLARIHLGLIPASENTKRTVAKRVNRQAENLVASGQEKDLPAAFAKIEESMLETIRQHDVLQAQKIQAQLGAAKQAQMDALKARLQG